MKVKKSRLLKINYLEKEAANISLGSAAHFEQWDRLLFRDYLVEHPEIIKGH